MHFNVGFAETDKHAYNEGKHEDGQPACQHEEEQSPSDYPMWV